MDEAHKSLSKHRYEQALTSLSSANLLIQVYGIYGVAFATSLSYAIQFFVYYIIIERKFGWDGSEMSYIRVIGLIIPVCLCVFVYFCTSCSYTSYVYTILQIVLYLLIFTLAYLLFFFEDIKKIASSLIKR